MDFKRDVRPILSNHCFHCHGPDEEERQADLRLDRQTGVETVVTPGDVDASELIRRITSEDPDERMPPAESKKPLTTTQIKVLTQWVQEGAIWEAHWAYDRPRRHPIPPSESTWPANWIDNFILQRLQQEELQQIGRAHV